MFCRNCGQEFDGNFCPNCGAGVAEKAKMEVKKAPFYKKWWFWLIIGFLVIMIAAVSSSSDEGTAVNDRHSSSTVENSTTLPKETKPAIPEEFSGICPITVAATVADNIIGVPELSCHIMNNTDKEIAAVQMYFVPKDVYGDEVSTIFTTNKIYTDSSMAANGSNTVSWQMLDGEVKTGDVYIYSVYFSDGTEWGDKDSAVSNIKKYAVKITAES